MAKRPGARVRGSETGRPIMVLLDVLGQRWTLRLLWELRQGPATFRALQARCEDMSPTVLNKRLKDLRALSLLALGDGGYALTGHGTTLVRKFSALDRWAEEWAACLEQR